MLNAADLVVAFGSTPQEVVALIGARRLEAAVDWKEAAARSREGAFSAARTAGYDVLADLRDSLAAAMRDGTTFEQWKSDIVPVLRRKGWWGKAVDRETGEVLDLTEGGRIATLGSPFRLRTIYETQLQVAYMAGRWNAMQEARDSHPYWQYVAILDTRTRPAHRALNGRVFSLDDPATSVAYPPNGYRCRCRASPISRSRLERMGLPVSSGAGAISTVEVPREGKTPIIRTVIRLPGMAQPFSPDPGWDHNPAVSAGARK
jgi:SPP1 gp7 family putative phage head morphogenesis protein